MSVSAAPARPKVDYPESDGKPMADNTKQFRWIQVIQGNLAALYRDDPNVFVAGDLLWYPVEGINEISNAPDVMVVFGRPKHDRGSYVQCEEDGIGPQVVFEVLSPSNSASEMMDKQVWYGDYEVQEYYVYDPQKNSLHAYRLEHDWLRPLRFAKEFVSPLLKIRFDLTGSEMSVFYPDGRPFLTFEQLEAERAREHQLRLDAEQRAEDAAQRARRLAQLTQKALLGQATNEDQEELRSLMAALLKP
jgi:Uma2 family endonuclease